MGNIDPMRSAKTVMASAQRVMGRRQVAFVRRQDGRDQGPGMADADPEDKVGDVEVPHHRPVFAGHTDPLINLVCEREDRCGED